ncbi:hypothetical protein TYRP_010550 [Tyrophagus putrescentiae]|nr:hypothetical protein TYRP_010550 [Tyrophagus putrescentiae]
MKHSSNRSIATTAGGSTLTGTQLQLDDKESQMLDKTYYEVSAAPAIGKNRPILVKKFVLPLSINADGKYCKR